jgi:hypothetical protein
LRTEITLKGFQLPVPDSKIFHVPERFTVLGVAKILHKSIVRTSGDPLQVKMFDETTLCIPSGYFEQPIEVNAIQVTRSGNIYRLLGWDGAGVGRGNTQSAQRAEPGDHLAGFRLCSLIQCGLRF